MNSECQFWMLDDDRHFFEKHAESLGHRIITNGPTSCIQTASGDIQYQLSTLIGATLSAGRISCRTEVVDLASKYRRLRSVITKRFDNDVFGESEALPLESRKIVRYPSMYVGPAAAASYRSGKIVLRQFHQGSVIFNLGDRRLTRH
jgi:hypothetical protein